MVILLHVVYVLVCLFLILVVLLQSGSGGGLGAGLGGASSASQQMFGGAGAGNILTKATSVSAAIFMVLSVVLAYTSSSSQRPTGCQRSFPRRRCRADATMSA